MKRAIVLILVLVYCMTLSNCCAETEDMVWFTPSVESEVQYSASEWYDNSSNRAMLTAMLCLEIASKDVSNNENLFEMLLNSSYVGKNGNALYVLGSTSRFLVFIGYTPSEKKASYQLFDISVFSETAEELIEEVMESQCPDGYYKNNSDDVIASLDMINTSINSIKPEDEEAEILDEQQGKEIVPASIGKFLTQEYYESGVDGIRDNDAITAMIPFGDQLGFYTVASMADNMISQIFFLLPKTGVTVSFVINNERTYSMEFFDIDGTNSYHTVYIDEQQLVHALAEATDITVSLNVNNSTSEHHITDMELATINKAFGYLDTHAYAEAVSPEYYDTCNACSLVYPMTVY